MPSFFIFKTLPTFLFSGDIPYPELRFIYKFSIQFVFPPTAIDNIAKCQNNAV